MGNVKYFRGSFLVTLVGLVLAFYIAGPSGLFIVAVLALLEISLSFDNAVVNATVLKDMDAIWRRRFLTWGILIAVFGMRIVFPVLIVSISAHVSPWGALDIALNTPNTYAALMTEAHVSLMAFGGAFLMLVGLHFFFDDDKAHWIHFIEKPLAALSNVKFASEMITLSIIIVLSLFVLPEEDKHTALISGVSGVLIFFIIQQISNLMERREQARVAKQAAKSGLAMFVYLELLDASFSFDGVIGAFAISTNLFIIAIGLGIGAMFVRSLTILLVEKDTLSEYTYLEHGAFYAIIALASMMFLKTFTHIPEVATGCIGAGLIGLAFVHSVIVRRQLEK